MSSIDAVGYRSGSNPPTLGTPRDGRHRGPPRTSPPDLRLAGARDGAGGCESSKRCPLPRERRRTSRRRRSGPGTRTHSGSARTRRRAARRRRRRRRECLPPRGAHRRSARRLAPGARTHRRRRFLRRVVRLANRLQAPRERVWVIGGGNDGRQRQAAGHTGHRREAVGKGSIVKTRGNTAQPAAVEFVLPSMGGRQKRLQLLALVAVLGLALVSGLARAANTPTAPKPLRVLFIGNSQTSTNDLPAFVAAIAKAYKQTISTARSRRAPSPFRATGTAAARAGRCSAAVGMRSCCSRDRRSSPRAARTSASTQRLSPTRRASGGRGRSCSWCGRGADPAWPR